MKALSAALIVLAAALAAQAFVSEPMNKPGTFAISCYAFGYRGAAQQCLMMDTRSGDIVRRFEP